MKASFGAAALAALSSVATAKIIPRQQGNLPPITVRGNAFYAGDERFYVRGVAYQPGGAADAKDPMMDEEGWARDVARFQELGINTIRIYTIDNTFDHTEAMKMLDDAGIYLTLDANSPLYSLNRESLESLHYSYTDVYMQNVFAIIDTFAGYNNLAMFYSGNEVIDAKNNSNAAPYVKAVTRDMKNYIRAQGHRQIPVGYSAADVQANIYEQMQYFACGDDEMARADFFALNDYSWCDPSNFERSGWNQKVEKYSNYTIPLFLSEYGCITNERNWGEVESLYHTNMTSVYSGGLAYEYTIEPNGYGIVEVQDGEIVPNRDYYALKDAFAATANPTGDGGARLDEDGVMDCPAESDAWQVATELLPEIPVNAGNMMTEGAGPGEGLDGNDGKGSQWQGTPSETDQDLNNGVTQSEVDQSGTAPSTGNGGNSNSDDSEGAASRPAAALAAVVVALGFALIM